MKVRTYKQIHGVGWFSGANLLTYRFGGLVKLIDISQDIVGLTGLRDGNDALIDIHIP